MFSIIIPIYNVQNYLAECLESIIQQADDIPIEVFLVDDGSTDLSGEIARKYANHYPNLFKYLKKENGGLSDARNFAIPCATHDYIFFIDSDDYIDGSALVSLKKIVEQHNPDLIIFDYYNAWADKKESVSISNRNEGFITVSDYLMMNPSAWNKIIKTKILKENNILFPKGLWYEDRATTGCYINYCNTVYYCKLPLYYYRQRENSIMQQLTYNPKMMDIMKAMDLFDKQVSDALYKDEKEYLFISNLLFQHAIRMLPLKKYQETNDCFMQLHKRYPCWKNNKYYLQQSKGYKFFCCLVSRKFYFLARKILEYRLRGGE